jgi:hypothetical protein
MSKHTQGPWHRNIKPASKYPVIFAGRNTHVAMLAIRGTTMQEAEIEANCDLIRAAPELLAALKRTLELLNEVSRLSDASLVDDNVSILHDAVKAIEKARGDQ